MRTVLDVLLELGGDLGRVDTVGNDIMAIAGELTTPQLHGTCGACDMPVRPEQVTCKPFACLRPGRCSGEGSAQGGSAKVL